MKPKKNRPVNNLKSQDVKKQNDIITPKNQSDTSTIKKDVDTLQQLSTSELIRNSIRNGDTLSSELLTERDFRRHGYEILFHEIRDLKEIVKQQRIDVKLYKVIHILYTLLDIFAKQLDTTELKLIQSLKEQLMEITSYTNTE